jgi:glycosyltransferase involved in cell wall biosynthesis
MMPMKKEVLNLHIYHTPFRYESRILKETRSIIDGGHAENIYIIGTYAPDLPLTENIDSRRKVFRVRTATRNWPSNAFTERIKDIEIIFRIFFRFRKLPVSFVNCHSLSVLPVGILFKIFRKSRLVYDTHELETERSGLYGFSRLLSKVLERIMMPFVDQTIVVSESIGKWYERKYSIPKVHVVRNIPYGEDTRAFRSDILKDTFKIRPDELLFIYQGILGRGRGIDIFLDVFSRLPKDRHMVFMGFGTDTEKVKAYAEKYPNIHFQPAVRPDQIKTYTSSADVGLHMAENICLSYYYSLPNKFFEYIHCELPVIVSDFPDMSAIVRKYDCGWAIPVDADSLYKKIMSLTKEEVLQKKANAQKCKLDYTWQNEEKKFAEIYNEIS